MAKRYFDYEDLKGIEGQFKPNGTLGKHDCYVTRHGGELTVVGSVAGWAVVQPRDTLGYDRGVVWLLPRPEEHQDPIRRVMAQARLSQKLLTYSNGDVQLPEGFYYGPEFFYSASIRTLGDFTKSYLTYRGGDALVVSSTFCNKFVNTGGVDKVIVRPTADKEKVATWLKSLWRIVE